MTTKRFCLALDLKDDPVLIEEYKNHHRHIWPEVYRSIKNAGIVEMEIYLFGNRLFMIMETVPEFTFEVKALADAANPKVRE
ncbi:MAG: L-rhamnose mutarotase, partial [Bacteroidetes bacterium]|nr:L-rhamnose mutarotase [Bacteroidota bacterium]